LIEVAAALAAGDVDIRSFRCSRTN
jgi:hypothetical protein